MSSAVSYAIKSGSVNVANNTKYSNVAGNVKAKKAQDVGGITLGVIFSLVYIGVTINWYVNLTHVEELTQQNCTNIYTTKLEWSLNNFCEHLITWKTCAILAIIVPGCLYFLLGLITMRVLSRYQRNAHSESSPKPSCLKLWSAFDWTSKVINIAIFCILLSSKAHSTSIGSEGGSGLKTATIVYMCIVGAEFVIGLFFLAVGLFCAFCGCAGLCCIVCCCDDDDQSANRTTNRRGEME